MGSCCSDTEDRRTSSNTMSRTQKSSALSITCSRVFAFFHSTHLEGTHIPHITQIGRTLLLGLIASALGSAQTLSDGFDYPVGNSVVTAANDGDGYYLFQGFGTGGHLGEDWNGEGGGNSDWGDPVYAVSNGTIVYAQNAGPGWGNIVIIEHLLPDGSRILSFYAHLDEILRSQGDVSKGQQIGTNGVFS